MKRLLGFTFGAAMMLMMASATPSAAFVCFPNPTCPDTMTIFGMRTVLNTIATCAPTTPNTTGSPGDTVLGVGGIIIGIDAIPTGFDVYIEMSGGGPTGLNAGLDVFTHGTNFTPTYGFALGDSIRVEYARVANFNGDVELEAPNNNFSAPNIIMRKISSGNPLPPFFSGNTTDFKETPTNTFFAPLVGELVTLTGPVRMARIITNTSTSKTALVVRDAAPSDSVFIDFSKLSTLSPAPLGVYYTSISGVGNAATRGWRIMPRDANDIVDAQPPSVADEYAVADNKYRIVFDRPVTTSSATNTSNYSLASFGTVNSAVMDGTSAVILTVSGTGLSHGQSETVTVNGITGVSNGLTMTTPGGSSFLAGVLSCGEMSAPNPDSLAATPCRDVSRYLGSPQVGVGSGVTGQYSNGPFGPRSTVTGIVVGIYGNLYYMEDANPSANRGITVFAPPTALTLGHRYILAGADEEFYSENEFAAIQYVSDQGAVTMPSPVPLKVSVASYDTCDGTQSLTSGRDYLSDLVILPNCTVVQRFPTLPTTGFHVVGPTLQDTIFCENQNNVLGANVSNNPNYPPLGSIVDVTGCVHYTTNTSSPSFRVCPRTPADIVFHTASVGGTGQKLSFSVFPNPARAVQLAFTLPRDSDVQLGVYDLVGRRVATIASGRMPAGAYQKQWQGVDDNGNKVHSGVYFYRLRAGSETRKVQSILIQN
jgi:hypothetical protein